MTRPSWIRPEGSFQIDIEGVGTLDFRVDGTAFLSEAGDDRAFRGYPFDGPPQRVVFRVLAGCVVLAEEFGDFLYRFDWEEQTLKEIARFSRSNDDDEAFMYSEFVDAGDRTLLTYENGLFCLDRKGQVEWHVAHGSFAYRFERIEDDLVWYCDDDGNSWAYRLGDGTEATNLD